MRYSFAFIERVLSAYRRTAAVGAGIVLSLACWVALDQPPGTKVWDFYTGSAIQSSAAIAPNGMLYFGTDSGKLYAFYPDGRGQWEFPTGDRIVASPAIGADGTIYFGGYNGIFYAIAPEGVERWRFRADGPIASSAAIGPDGTICFGTLNNRLFALRPDGTKVWDLASSDPVVGSPAVDARGTVYVPSADGVLAALSLKSGDILWEYEAPNRILSSPALGADGTVYFGCFDGHLYAVDRLGKKKWTFATGGPVRGSAAIGPDGTIYFGSDDRQLYALAPDGFKKWTFTVGRWIRSTPAVAADGTVYIGSYDHSLYAVGPSGAKKWEFVTDNNVTASPALGADGTVFFGSWNGRFYAVRGDASLAGGSWPRFHGGSRQTGFLDQPAASPPPVQVARAKPMEEPPAPVISVRQEPGSVIGNWWQSLRARKKSSDKVEVDPASVVTEPDTTVVLSEPTTVIAVAPEPPPVNRPEVVGTMTPVWENPPVRSAKVDAAPPTIATSGQDLVAGNPVKPATAGVEAAPAIVVKQEPGSVLGNWWRRHRGSAKPAEAVKTSLTPEPVSAPIVDYTTTTVETQTTVRGAPIAAAPRTATNLLDDHRERAYKAQLEAMRHRVADLEAELRFARSKPAPGPVAPAPAPRVIADSRDLVPATATTVVSAREKSYQTEIAEMESRAQHLNDELARERAKSKDLSPASAMVTSPKPVARPGMIPMMRLISVGEKPVETPSPIKPEVIVPAPAKPASIPAPVTSPSPPEASFRGIDDINAAWGEEPEKQQTLSASRHSQREAATVVATTAEPELVTAREREYQQGFFQRMFTRTTGRDRRDSAVREIPSPTSDPSEPSAVKVIADSDTLVTRAVAREAPACGTMAATTASVSPAPVVTEREALLENRITALEKHLAELNAQLAERDAERSTAPPVVTISAPAKPVSDDAGKTVDVTPVVPEAPAAKVIADSADLVDPKMEPRIEEVFVDRKESVAQTAIKEITTTTETVASATTVKPTPEKVSERRPQPGLLNRILSRSESGSAALRSSGETVEAPPEPNEVVVFEREYQPGFFQRLFTGGGRSRGPAVREISSSAVREIEVEEKPAPAVTVTSVAAAKADDDKVMKPSGTEAKEARPKPDGFDANLASLEERLTEMNDELKETRLERDDLKRQIGSGIEDKVVAVAAKETTEAALEPKEPKAAAPAKAAVQGIDPALQKAYGDKISLLESHLVSLSEELGNARVERARLREELANTRQGGAGLAATPVPVTPVAPESPLPTGVRGTVIADSASLAGGTPAPEIPQPEWLKQEVRSVIATADPWAQPPGATVATVDAGASHAPAPSPAARVVTETPAVAASTAAVVEIPESPDSDDEPEARPAKRRKPGFFSRLFGRGGPADEERVVAATNVVVVHPTASAGATVASRPTDAQLLGNDTGFGSGAVQTNFPRVAFTPAPGTSFFAPGAGNVTQLPGFPRPQPALTPPPARAMDPTRITTDSGLKTVEVRDTVTAVAAPDAGVTRVEDLSVRRPVVAIMSPADGATLTSPVLDLRGLAQGDRRIAQVLVSLDGGPFESAAGLERWSFQRPVNGDHVLVRVKAIDATGRESEVVERAYGHRVTSPLKVDVGVGGRVEPDLNGQLLVVGQAYTVTAVPADGFEFVGWRGAANTAEPRLTFKMNRDLYLSAEFRPVAPPAVAVAPTPVPNSNPSSAWTPVVTSTPAPRAIAGASRLRGAYTGLVYPGEFLQADRSGYFEMQIEDDGTFNGEIRLATSAAPLRGRFDANGRASQTIERPGAEPITLRFSREDDGGRITGFFDADGVGIVMRAYRSVPDGDTLAAITPGRYTLVIPGPPDAGESGSPAGDGFGEVWIGAGGQVKFTGELPDGSKVEQETRISASGVWPLYVPLYGGEGMLTGWISVTNHPTLDLHGDLRWIKPARPSDRFYPGGFAARRFVFGSIYQPAHDDLSKRKGLAGVLLGGNLGRLVLGQDVAGLPLTSPQRETLRQFDYQIDPDSGRVEGTFVHPETRQPTAFRGMLVQKRGWKSGYFMGADASGVVHLNGR